MFLGHYGVAFGAKAAAPKTSLGTLVLASQFADLLWSALLMTGVERVVINPGATGPPPLDFVNYPFSHSLLAVVMTALCFGIVYRLLMGYNRGSVVVGLAVICHWLLDSVVHHPDLPLYPGSDTLVGLGLWSSLSGALFVEILIFATGLWLYLRATVARDAIGTWALWEMASLLVVVYLASEFGPPPPNVAAIEWSGQGQWLFIFWAYWADRHRGIAKTAEGGAYASGT